ncbi:hypothetical protein GA662_10395 [Bifidobacterium adolescentis]|nr:hypothetical protein GA662_10395 [Bifidobacterium adolescentis]KAB6803839.1 hypothetical protein GBK72_11480 [Bifidobacterium longum]
MSFECFDTWKRNRLFLVISIITGNRLAYEKERIRFAIDCKSDPFFQFEAEFFQNLFFTKT